MAQQALQVYHSQLDLRRDFEGSPCLAVASYNAPLREFPRRLQTLHPSGRGSDATGLAWSLTRSWALLVYVPVN